MIMLVQAMAFSMPRCSLLKFRSQFYYIIKFKLLHDKNAHEAGYIASFGANIY